MTAPLPLPLDGTSLTLAALDRIADGTTPLTLPPAAWEAIRAGRAVVERMVDNAVPAYGITTGFGSQKDYALSADDMRQFNRQVLIGHASFAPGPAADPRIVRATLAIQLNLFATGRSGIRPELAALLLERLNSGHLTGLRGGSSVGASDIVALSQAALPLLGLAPPDQSAPDGPAMAEGLAAKEAMSLLNSNAFTLAQAALAVTEARRLLDAAHRAAALSLEGFRGNPASWSAAVDRAHPQAGQIRAGETLRGLLTDSRLWQPGEARFLQDPLSFRCVPQIHGAAEAALSWAEDLLTCEINASVDNPTVDLLAGHTVSHGNMESGLIALALDTLRLALAKLVQAANERCHKLQWPAFSGLPTGLAAEGGAVGGVQFLNLGHLAAAKTANALRHAAPASLLYHGQICDGVEDVAGMAPQAADATRALLDEAWQVVALESAIAVWACHRRALPSESLGTGLRRITADLLPLLPIGREGISPFDLAPVLERVKAGVP